MGTRKVALVYTNGSGLDLDNTIGKAVSDWVEVSEEGYVLLTKYSYSYQPKNEGYCRYKLIEQPVNQEESIKLCIKAALEACNKRVEANKLEADKRLAATAKREAKKQKTNVRNLKN